MRQSLKMPSLSNVVAGSTATLECPVGKTYLAVTFALTNVTPAQMKNIQVRLGAKTVQEYASGDVLEKLNKFYGLQTGTGFLTLYFEREEMANLKQRQFTAFGTAGVSSFQILFDIDSAVTNPAITAWADVTDARPLGQIIKVKRFPMANAVAGQFELDKLVKGPTMRAIHVIDTDATNDTKPTHLEVEMDSYKVWEATDALRVYEQSRNRTPQTGIFSADFTLSGDWGDSLVTARAQDFRVRPTLANAGAVDVLVEYIDKFAGI